ncbi:hypothetical protein [Dysgonomonas sp. GY75]|nr:hypothetical protein [Dysgonomonas sp. GY75]
MFNTANNAVDSFGNDNGSLIGDLMAMNYDGGWEAEALPVTE